MAMSKSDRRRAKTKVGKEGKDFGFNQPSSASDGSGTSTFNTAMKRLISDDSGENNKVQKKEMLLHFDKRYCNVVLCI